MRKALLRHTAAAAAALACFVPCHAQSWTWPTTFTDGSAPSLTQLHWALVGVTMKDPGVPVHGVTLRAEGFELAIESGTIWLEPAVDGARAGAYFEGQAKVRFAPSGKKAAGDMKFWFGQKELEPTPVKRAYVFTPGGQDLLAQLGVTDAPSVPWQASSGYEECKHAFRQLGLSVTTAFLERSGRESGSTVVIFPLDATRDGRSNDALMMYAFDPSRRSSVGLLAGGYEFIAADPWKHFFYPVSLSRSASHPFEPQARVHSYTTRLEFKKLGTTDTDTAIRFTPTKNVRALSVVLNPRLKVSKVEGVSGPLPFAQWGWQSEKPNPDSVVVVDLGENAPAGKEIVIKITSSGKLFDPFFNNWVLADEDTWYPQLDDPERSDYDLTIRCPKGLKAVAPGQLVSDEVAEGIRTAHFKTIRPQRAWTLYLGPFETLEGDADGTKVEVYSDRHRTTTTVAYDEFMDMPVEARGTSKSDVDYAKQEIENAIKTYKRILGPIDLEMLRVASTPTGHGRGFEGLLLLSKFGGFDSDDSRADLFRAHEVAHLWWGGVVDPLDWRDDRWIGESFADYLAMEYYNIRFQKPEKTREWIQQQWVRPVLGASREPVVSLDGKTRRIRSSEMRPLIAGTQNVYTKGPLVIHMLRNLFVLFNGNDVKFWELLQDFLEQNKGKLVTTEDFIAATEKKLGGQIPWFWDDWVYGSDLPHVRWSSTTAQQGSEWIVTVDAKQEGTTFQLPIPVYVDLGDNKRLRQYLNLSGATGRAVIKCPRKPKTVSLNDNYEVLAFIEKQ